MQRANIMVTSEEISMMLHMSVLSMCAPRNRSCSNVFAVVFFRLVNMECIKIKNKSSSSEIINNSNNVSRVIGHNPFLGSNSLFKIYHPQAGTARQPNVVRVA